jgi:hypothetical protein
VVDEVVAAARQLPIERQDAEPKLLPHKDFPLEPGEEIKRREESACCHASILTGTSVRIPLHDQVNERTNFTRTSPYHGPIPSHNFELVTITNSTAYSRDLGDELRRLRQRFTGLRGRGLAIQLGWDPSKVSNIEHGKIRASEIDLAQYLSACGKDIDFIEDFFCRYHNAFDPYFVQAPGNFRTLAMTEAAATKITAYDVITVHSLLQTPGYARALQAATHEDVADELDRQAVMRRPAGPECVFYLHEIALRVRLGSEQVMHDQHVKLLAHANIVRIVPAEATTAAFQSKCTLFEFGRTSPLVYAESGHAKVFAQDAAAVDRAEKLFDLLDSVALDENQTRRKLTEYTRLLAPVHALAGRQ